MEKMLPELKSRTMLDVSHFNAILKVFYSFHFLLLLELNHSIFDNLLMFRFLVFEYEDL